MGVTRQIESPVGGERRRSQSINLRNGAICGVMTNHPNLQNDGVDASRAVPQHRRRWRLGVAVSLGLALTGAAGAELWFRSARRPVPAQPIGQTRIGGPFSLVDPAGRPVADRDFRGKYMLVYFGYTHCPDVCPTVLAKVAAALPLVGAAAGKIQPIFITVDPDHDTPEVMGKYVDQFSSRILGLTGSPTQIAQAEKDYRVYASPHATPAELDAAIDHSSILYLMGPNGRFIAPVQNVGSPQEIAADIARYL